MDLWVQSALRSILRRDPIFESAAWFFVIILKFIFTSIFEIKIHEKKNLDTKKISFSKADSVWVKKWDIKTYFLSAYRSYCGIQNSA